MMKVSYVTKDKQIKVEFEVEDQKNMFKNLAVIQEVAEHEPCGACGSTNTIFSVRTVKDNDYYEKRCLDCGSALSFGQHKNGKSVFPKRETFDGEFDQEHGGWKKWKPGK